MKTVKVKFGTIDMVKKFVKVIGNYEGYFDLTSGRYTIDAKSIMGIFTMNISKVLDLKIIENSGNMDRLMEDLTPFIVEA